MSRCPNLCGGLGRWLPWVLTAGLAAQSAAGPEFGAPDRLLPWMPEGARLAWPPTDLDADGVPDLLFLDRGFATMGLRFLAGTAAGRFEDRPDVLPMRTDRVDAVAVLDADRDGLPDLIVATSTTLVLWRQDGSGGFVEVPGHLPMSSFRPSVLRVGDVDRDGFDDLLLGGARDVALWLSDRAGGFVDATELLPIRFPAGFVDAVLVDLDGDGDLDIGLARGFQDADAWFNDGRGLFFPSATRVPAGVRNTTAVVGFDADVDGDVDLLFGRSSADPVLWASDGRGFFVDDSAALPVGLRFERVATADVDGDGDVDAFVDAAGQPVVLRNDGAAGLVRVDVAAADAPPVSGVHPADLDGDGDADLVAGSTVATPRLWWNDGVGGLQDVTTRIAPLLRNTQFVRAGDFDGDGLADVLSFDDAATVLWVGDGDGSGVGRPTALPNAPRGRLFAVGVADVDGDGDPDVLVGGDRGAPELWRNDGRGGFALDPATPGGTLACDAIELADVDGDGDLDALLLSGLCRQANALWLNDGLGGFVAAPGRLPSLDPGLQRSRQAAFADLDGDGDPDLAIEVAGELQLWRNDGTGTFTVWTGGLPTVVRCAYVAAGDLDGDGDADLAVRDGSGGGSVWIQSGAGSFIERPQPREIWARNAQSLALADLDADSDLDLLFSTADGPAWSRNVGLATADFEAAAAPIAGASADALGVVPIDLDGDGDLDLYQATGGGSGAIASADHVLFGLRRQLVASGEPRLGKPWELRLLGRPGETFLINTAFARARTEVPGLGVLRLDPATILLFASGNLDPQGRFAAMVDVPADPALLDVAVHFQAASGASLRLGNAVSVTVRGL